MTRRRVVVTGLGTVNPLALNVPDSWRGLLAGHSGIAPITLFDTAAFKVHFAGEVKNFRPDPVIDGRTVRRLDRFTQFALVAAAEAVQDAGIDFETEDASAAGASSAAASAASTSSRTGRTSWPTAVPAGSGRS